jgi:hypothetical protein
MSIAITTLPVGIGLREELKDRIMKGGKRNMASAFHGVFGYFGFDNP